MIHIARNAHKAPFTPIITAQNAMIITAKIAILIWAVRNVSKDSISKNKAATSVGQHARFVKIMNIAWNAMMDSSFSGKSVLYVMIILWIQDASPLKQFLPPMTPHLRLLLLFPSSVEHCFL